ncbi:MAG: recombinase family protein [Clostridia bacterium]|nr:recombinase family protein [Clostridia bacterium]
MTNAKSYVTMNAVKSEMPDAPNQKEDNMTGANKITALYCRLSQEDARLGESLSIENQKTILDAYAKDHHFGNIRFFVDDGFSGTDFDRPGFQAMLKEIEAGNVSTVLSKDLSRMGRNSALLGLYTNFTFPQHGVRYIAINDNYDTADLNSVNNDFAGIKNWFNEFYARDTSRKIRAVNKARGEKGIPLTTNVPYGYCKDPNDSKKWLIDPEAAEFVRKIFSLCMEGRGPRQIANQLTKEKILVPSAYHHQQGRKIPSPMPDDPFHWYESTIVAILERREYTGCTVNFKTYRNSIWDKKQRKNAEENYSVFYDTHPAIIEPDVFEKVQQLRKQRHRRTKTGKSSIFSGLVFCADCGERMYYCTSTKFEKRQDFFVCSTHRMNNSHCSSHYIRAVVLEELVLRHVQAVTGYILRYEEHFREIMNQQLLMQSENTIRDTRRELEKSERRIEELKRLFMKIYEDNASGKLSDDRYELLSQSYETEQKSLEAEVEELRKTLDEQKKNAENLEAFIQTSKKYVGIESLDAYVLHDLIRAIYIEAPDRSTGKRRQNIRIEYDGIGFIPINELIKEAAA